MLKLNLGCGYRKIDGFVNIDIRSEVGPDFILDLTKPLPFKTNSIARIRAFDVIEHLYANDVINLIREIHRVLKPNGFFHFFVPSTEGRGAFQDLTHKSFFNINTWIYFTSKDWADLYDYPLFKILKLNDKVTSKTLRIVHTEGTLTPIK